MFEIILIIIAMAVVCSALCGIAAYAWTEVSERKLKKRLAKSEEKITALGDWQLMHATKLNLLQNDFDRLVQEKFPELWPEFSLKDPEDRKRYREASLKLSIAINCDAGKSLEKLNEIHRNVTEALASIGKEQPSRRLKEGLKPAWFYEEIMEPLVMATYPDQIGSMKRGSLDWIREVLYDLRRKKEMATGLRKEALERAIDFCNGLLAEPGPDKSHKIDYQHEIRLARRYLFTRRSDTPKLKNWDPSFTQGIVGWGEVESVLSMAQEGQLVEWIETKYNTQCQPHAQINTGKEAPNV